MTQILTPITAEEVAEQLPAIPFGIWFLIGAALVFFMNAGFAMLEAGFTRAKNAANIIMKNLIDFSLGTIFFALIGFSIMMAEDYVMGIIGVPNLDIFANFANFDSSNFIFNLVFCATAATIVSGAMAERTKFSAYCIYSIVISAVVYPIEAGWVWNSAGWLAERGYVDFAGSSAIHMVGGISAFLGAAFLGPRIGKYTEDKKTGKKKAHAIPGHSLTLGALGCFILWFGWYGFNGAAAGSVDELGKIFVTTTIAPAVGAVTTMLFTWFKNKKPDVSMSLNGALAGLVGITAGCGNLDAFGAFVVGAVAGILVVLAVEFIDLKLHVDDPVGAVAVHGVNGIWGTIAVGLLAVPYEAELDGGVVERAGLFYGGGAGLLSVQVIGVIAIAAWTIAAMSLAFFLIKKAHGLRASAEDEIMGLDTSEHGLASSYADFLPVVSPDSQALGGGSEKKASAPVPVEKAVPVTDVSSGTRLTKVTIITKQSKFEHLKDAFDRIGITGITVTNVLGYGIQRGGAQMYRGVPVESQLMPKIQIDIVISKVPLELLIETVKEVLYTGNIGDGKIFVYDVENVIKIRTGEEGYAALQDPVPGDE
ncbi:MAG: ammonium transporter [Oscillospiraceae bacterium]|jgi:Amt family ammonium transporter|nr:ammonium transporter [Oscillospiraceae bacterium]